MSPRQKPYLHTVTVLVTVTVFAWFFFGLSRMLTLETFSRSTAVVIVVIVGFAVVEAARIEDALFIDEAEADDASIDGCDEATGVVAVEPLIICVTASRVQDAAVGAMLTPEAVMFASYATDQGTGPGIV